MTSVPPGGYGPWPPPGGPQPPSGGFPPQQWSQPGPPPQHPGWAPGYTAAPPPKRGGGLKWVLLVVALVAVIGVTVAVTLSVVDGRDATPMAVPASGTTSDIASANDTGPVTIITEEPTCAAWETVYTTLGAAQKKGWVDRDKSVPAAEWTQDQRQRYLEVGEAFRLAAAQAVPLAKLTPHRVVREAYEQFIAYSLLYSDAVPSYVPQDHYWVAVAGGAMGMVANICNSITLGSAQSRIGSVGKSSSQLPVTKVDDPGTSAAFMSSPDPECAEMQEFLRYYNVSTQAWQQIDSSIPALQWSPSQRASFDDVAPVMREYAYRFEKFGLASSNPAFRDFAFISAQYRRAYVEALPTYVAADSYLSATANNAANILLDACRAAES